MTPTQPQFDLAELRRLAEAALASEDELRSDWWPVMVNNAYGAGCLDGADAAYIASLLNDLQRVKP